MAQKTAQQARLIAERAHALATILLTRRADVSLHEPTDLGLDFVATMTPRGKRGPRQLGVAIQAAWAGTTAEPANTLLKPTLQRLLRAGPFPFPVVVFFFTMEDDRAWFTWASEPTRNSGVGHLQAQGEASCSLLNDSALNEIIEQVNAWYDAFDSRTVKLTSPLRA